MMTFSLLPYKEGITTQVKGYMHYIYMHLMMIAPLRRKEGTVIEMKG